MKHSYHERTKVPYFRGARRGLIQQNAPISCACAAGDGTVVESGEGSKPARQQANRQVGLLPPQQLPLHRRHLLPRSAFLVAPIAFFLLSMADYFYVVVFSDLQRSQL